MSKTEPASSTPSLTPSDGPRDRSLRVRFEAQAAAAPDATAIVCGTTRLSYGELDARANRLALLLAARGVGDDTPVALALERSPDMIVALLAVLKAGGAYVPLDPKTPASRVAFILENCSAELVLTTGAVRSILPGDCGTALICIDDPETAEALQRMPPLAPVVPASDRDPLAYIIYTSGSTGQPKGVAVPQSNVLALFDSTQSIYDFGPQDVWTLFHSYAFDFSVWEIWGALLFGGRLVIVEDAARMSPPAFLDLLAREQVTVLNQTPSAFYALIQAEARRPGRNLSLRYVIFGGEGLDLARLRPWYDRQGDGGPQLFNMYGITETTVHVTWIRLNADMARREGGSLIGDGIPGWTVHLLDPTLNPIADGEVGEIFVSGPGVALGYVGRPDLTAERFLPDPFGPAGSRMYRSGDLARRRPDGGLEYLGRADQQVKISGYRIELGEIEATLEALPAVAQAAAAPRERAGETRLVAWIVPRDSAIRPDASELGAALANRLPDYMTPSAFMFVDTLPLTLNGKLDRQALPSPWQDDLPRAATPAKDPADTTPEQRLQAIFAVYLGVSEVSPHTAFFDLGLRSIDLIKISAALQDNIDPNITVTTLLECGNISKLALHIADSRDVNSSVVSVTDRARQGRLAIQRRRIGRSRIET